MIYLLYLIAFQLLKIHRSDLNSKDPSTVIRERQESLEGDAILILTSEIGTMAGHGRK